MLRDQRGKVGRGRVCVLGGGLGGAQARGRFVSYWLFKVVQFKNWINLI